MQERVLENHFFSRQNLPGIPKNVAYVIRKSLARDINLRYNGGRR